MRMTGKNPEKTASKRRDVTPDSRMLNFWRQHYASQKRQVAPNGCGTPTFTPPRCRQNPLNGQVPPFETDSTYGTLDHGSSSTNKAGIYVAPCANGKFNSLRANYRSRRSYEKRRKKKVFVVIGMATLGFLLILCSVLAYILYFTLTDGDRIEIENSPEEKGLRAVLILKITNFNYTVSMNSNDSSSFQTIAIPLCAKLKGIVTSETSLSELFHSCNIGKLSPGSVIANAQILFTNFVSGKHIKGIIIKELSQNSSYLGNFHIHASSISIVMKDSIKESVKTTSKPKNSSFARELTSTHQPTETTSNILNLTDSRTSLISRNTPEQTTHGPSTGTEIKLTASATTTATEKVKKHTTTSATTPKENSTFRQTTKFFTWQTTTSIDKTTNSTKTTISSIEPEESTTISENSSITGVDVKTTLRTTSENKETSREETAMTDYSNKDMHTKTTRVRTTDKTSNHSTFRDSSSFTSKKSMTTKKNVENTTRRVFFTKRDNSTSSTSYITSTTSGWFSINETTLSIDYSSYSTSIKKNPCHSNPCTNNGSCENLGNNSFKCHCASCLCFKHDFGPNCENSTINEAFNCSTKRDGYYSSPNSCSQFFQCNKGVRLNIDCPRGLVFNPEISKCDYIQNVACALDSLKELQIQNKTYSCKNNPCKSGSTCREIGQIGFECQCSENKCGCPNSGKLCDFGYSLDDSCLSKENSSDSVDCLQQIQCITGRLPPRGGCSIDLFYDHVQRMCVHNSSVSCAQT
ncbi:DgyrCDS8725 [Dimorphilus gyrociliatus]|uniref:DgyrCDS8725 n=1 Tax=Dimorphilus gyrociliatus TaxID=2664684 RepID=A0A7I8VWH1_9ANNE|nr:DgyrCDS8725 [Dimorphilus gyrociliatus]